MYFISDSECQMPILYAEEFFVILITYPPSGIFEFPVVVIAVISPSINVISKVPFGVFVVSDVICRCIKHRFRNRSALRR